MCAVCGMLSDVCFASWILLLLHVQCWVDGVNDEK
jgi:hypothetical protein